MNVLQAQQAQHYEEMWEMVANPAWGRLLSHLEQEEGKRQDAVLAQAQGGDLGDIRYHAGIHRGWQEALRTIREATDDVRSGSVYKTDDLQKPAPA